MRPTLAAILLLSSSSAQSQSLDELREMYQYDPTAHLDLQKKDMASPSGYKVYSISSVIPRGRMARFLVTPDRRGRKPAIVWMHSGGSIQFLGNAVLLAKSRVLRRLRQEARGLTD